MKFRRNKIRKNNVRFKQKKSDFYHTIINNFIYNTLDLLFVLHASFQVIHLIISNLKDNILSLQDDYYSNNSD